MTWQKTDNSSLESKVMLRKHFLGLQKKNRILDLFQGVEKKMYKLCYEGSQRVESYKGYDIKAIEASSRLNNKKAILVEDLDAYNFFDLDAYGSPWELFFNIMIRFEDKGKKTFVVTDGLFLNNRFSSTTILQKACMNIPKRFKIPCLHRHHIFFLGRLFKKVEELTGYKLLTFKKSFVSGIRVQYFGFQLEKT